MTGKTKGAQGANAKEPAIDLTDADGFRHWTPVTIRFSDQDPMGHVNNVSFAAYVEAARTMFIDGILGRFDHPGLDFILARVTINYLSELHYPGTVEVGARLLRLGNKSLTSGYGVFRDRLCVATAESVNVFFDAPTRKTVSPPDNVRAALEAELNNA